MSPLWTITSGLRAHVRLISSPDFAKQPRRCSSDRKEAAGARAEIYRKLSAAKAGARRIGGHGNRPQPACGGPKRRCKQAKSLQEM